MTIKNYPLFLFFTALTLSTLTSQPSDDESMNGSSPKTSPSYYLSKGYSTPLPAALQAAFNGTITAWTDGAIKDSIDITHEESGDTMAHIACDATTLERILRCSRKHLYTPNKDGNTPIQQFVRRHHAQDLLITAFTHLQSTRNGINYVLNAHRNKFGDTAAHIAVAAGQYENLRVLCRYGADLTLHNTRGESVHETARRLLIRYRKPRRLYEDAIKEPFTPIDQHKRQFPEQRSLMPAAATASESIPKLTFNPNKLKNINPDWFERETYYL